MKKNSKNLRRACGVVMPIFSIPSKYGIGTFGKEAYDMVDFFSECNIHYRQILPLGPTSYGDSPYQSFSSFAGNPYFIDLEMLEEEGLLEKEDFENVNFGENPSYVDYSLMYNMRFRVLEKAYENAKEKLKSEIAAFRKKEAFWIEDYALFMAIKKEKLDVSRLEFPEELRDRDPKALKEFQKDHKDEIDFQVFLQYEFFKQWEELKKYANRHDIEIIGDLPIYLALDSADAWANSHILKLDEEKNPTMVGGCPPDGYSEDGQLWGNPVYDWEKMQEDDFEFWKNRIGINLKIFDLLRLDHFRGFEAFYQIPSTDDNAKYGEWEKARPEAFFKMVEKNFPDAKFIAEDLGFITKEVEKLIDKLGYPGMKVIQFAFGDDFKSPYLPHNYERNSIVYSSTHDSDTLKGRYNNLDEDMLSMVNDYFGLKKDEPENLWRIMRTLMASVSDVAMYQIQDFLELGNESKINSPGTLGENWKRRADKEDFTDDLSAKIKKMTKLYGRN
jgi:4-alpha-glucanotransferase